MPCTGKTLSLTNISCLDFKLDWDISGASPVVKITNNSTVVDATKLKWWFYITSPSGSAIYGMDINATTPPTPDVNQVAWTTKTYVLQTPFGNPPCGQVEFSPNSPYTVTVFVQDVTGVVTPIDNYSKTTIIVRPNGNTVNTCGNFGKASISVKSDCANKLIMCFDGTKLIYNNILVPASTTQKWTLVYPADDAGDVPNMEVLNVPNVNFPVGVNSKGYALYFNETATYDYGNNITVKVQYKLYDKDGDLGQTFAVNCNTNLCQLQCQMKRFYELSTSKCGELENAALTQKMVRLQWIFSQILTGIFQPLCGIDVPGLISEMKEVGNFDDDCDCGCGCDESQNFGFSNPTGGGGTSSSTCCPQISNVMDINTNLPPGACPASFFPAAVYSPDGSTVIGMATSADSMISIINGNAAWNVYGTAFNMGNCQVGFYLNPGINSVPPVIVNPGTVINVIDQTSGFPPAACPASYFPVTVYAPDGTTPIGTAANITQLITIINSNAAWQAYGTAYYNSSYCTVAFVPASGVDPSTIPPIIVSSTTGCVGGIQHYTANVQDICGQDIPPITVLSFPMNAWVDFGSGLVALGMITDNAAFIAALNAASGKPPSVTFTAGTSGGMLNYTIDNTDCAGYSGVVQIYTDTNAGAYLLYGANHKTIALPQPNVAGVYGVGIKTMAIIGRIAGLANDEFWWHVTRVQSNYLLVTNADQGRVYCFDISNPLNPTLFGMVQLPDTGSGNCFTGLPQQWGVDMHYGLYFPTDYHTMNLREIYVCESSTGSIWHVDFMTSVPSVPKYYQDQRLIGQCPRIHEKGWLWFSTDGSYQAITGPGEPNGEVVRFGASSGTWNPFSLTSISIFPNFVEQVWAASYDSANSIIYFSGKFGSIGTYDTSIDSMLAVYANVMGQYPTDRLNTKFYANKLYHSSYGAYTTPGGLNTATRFIDTTTLGTTNVITNFQSFLSNNRTHWNFMPLGNCNGVLTFENGANGAGFALFKLDGTYIGLISYVAGATYNVVPIAGVGVYTPNSLI